MSPTIEQKSYTIIGGDQLTKYAPQVFQLGTLDNGLGIDALRLMKEDFGYNNPVLHVEVLAKPQRLLIDDKTLQIGREKLMGSNVFIRYALGSRVKRLHGGNIELITPSVSEQLIEQAFRNIYNTRYLFGREEDRDLLERLHEFYENLGVVAYEKNGPNEQLKQHLINQARERGIPIEFPMLFYRLKTVKDDKFVESRGLRLDLDDAEEVAFHAPVLGKGSREFSTYDTYSDDPSLTSIGLPRRSRRLDGFSGPQLEYPRGVYVKRRIYVADSGLRNFTRHRDFNLVADNTNLLTSGDAGRISFIVGEIPQNLEDTVARLDAEKKTKQVA